LTALPFAPSRGQLTDDGSCVVAAGGITAVRHPTSDAHHSPSASKYSALSYISWTPDRRNYRDLPTGFQKLTRFLAHQTFGALIRRMVIDSRLPTI